MEPGFDASHQGENRRLYYVSGKPVELWEDPLVPFGWGEEELSTYATSGRWELLFNALVLASFLDQEPDQT